MKEIKQPENQNVYDFKTITQWVNFLELIRQRLEKEAKL